MELIKVGIIEDDKIIHQSLVNSVELYASLQLAFDFYNVEDALSFSSLDTDMPDVILLDIGLPGMTGIEGVPHLIQKYTDVNIIMLTAFDESELIFEALSAGACSYISKKTSLKVIMDSIFTVYRGGSYMSPSIARKMANYFNQTKQKEIAKPKLNITDRQMEIVKALSKGLSYKLVADELSISIDTVRTHIKKIYKTLQVNSKIEVINLYNNGRV